MPMQELSKGPDGSTWQFRVATGLDPATGRYGRAVEHFHGPTQTGRNPPQAVKNAYAAFLARVHSGELARTRGATLNAAWDKYLEVVDLAPYTRVSYTGYWDKHVRGGLGRTNVSDLTPMMLTSLYSALRSQKGLSPLSVRKVHALIRNALKTAVNELRWIKVNPATEARVPRASAHRAPPSPEPEHVAALVDLAQEENPDLAVFLELAIGLGSRRGETLALSRSCLEDREDGSMVIHVRKAAYKVKGQPVGLKDPKDHQLREVHLAREVAVMVRAHLARQKMRANTGRVEMAEDPFLFASDLAGRTPWLPDYATKRFAALWRKLEASEVHKAPHAKLHDLRHHHATELERAGVPLTVIRDRLGHSSLAVTSIYTSSSKKADAAAAAAFEARRQQQAAL